MGMNIPEAVKILRRLGLGDEDVQAFRRRVEELAAALGSAGLELDLMTAVAMLYMAAVAEQEAGVESRLFLRHARGMYRLARVARMLGGRG